MITVQEFDPVIYPYKLWVMAAKCCEKVKKDKV